MFTAYDEMGKKVSITQAEKGRSYYCPLCNEMLIVKKGKIKVPHFSHKPDSSCVEDWGDMSVWHLDWQEKFPVECREFVMEKNGEKHRADIYIEAQKLVIEFQHSFISCEEFNKRNQFYADCGYEIVWVFDAAEKIKDINNYSIPPGANGRPSRIADYYTQPLEWKRKQSTFEWAFERNKGREIAIYLEVQIETLKDKTLIGLKSVDEYRMDAYYTAQYILAENFLKEYGGFCSGDILSIREIVEATNRQRNMVQNMVRTNRVNPPTYSRPILRRRWRL